LFDFVHGKEVFQNPDFVGLSPNFSVRREKGADL
jgi:hypothetical protein